MDYKMPDPWYVVQSSLEDFVLGMLTLGHPIDTSLVGVFDDSSRGSRRDIALPMHRDGEYSQKLAEVQGGTYVEAQNIDIVGLYCIREGQDECVTTIQTEGSETIDPVNLRTGEAVVFDNKRVLHGREGKVGDRLLLRVWLRRR